MKILVITEYVPMPDRASGDLRFFTLLGMLARSHTMTLATVLANAQKERIGYDAFSSYCDQLRHQGIEVVEQVVPALKQHAWNVVLFEFYLPARPFLDKVRYYLPSAHVVVDSVDVHFRRLGAKAALTGKTEDRDSAQYVQREELDIYRRADMVIAVTEDDRQLLQKYLPDKSITVLPNVHAIHQPAAMDKCRPNSVVFVGGFQHEPNVDAMIYFSDEIMPLIRQRIPNVHLTIVGSHPPEAIQALASESVEVTGYVPDTAPYLVRSQVSIAPLRYGAGMKGKIGEAMSHAVPVVTTSVGAEGFGFTAGQHLLVADSPSQFADHVVSLLQDSALCERIRMAGWDFIKQRYSLDAVENLCQSVFSNLAACPIQQLSIAKRMRMLARIVLDTHMPWVLRKAQRFS